MAIDQKKYIDITSGVGGESSVDRRDMMGRVMTTNALAEIGETYELDLDGVGTLFGTTSEEYSFASKYFSFISKSVTQAENLSFTGWIDADTTASIVGTDAVEVSISTWAAITDGSFTINVDGSEVDVSALDFSAVTSMSEVAAVLGSGGDFGFTDWNDAGQYISLGSISSGSTSSIGYPESTSPAIGTDISSMMGLLESDGATITDGEAEETPVAAITRVSELSDNFGSFMFLDSLTNAEIDLVAAWVTAGNYKFLYSVPVLAANATDLTDLLGGATGTIVTLTDALTDYAEYMPMVLFATTDYDSVNSVKNFMFQSFDSDTPTVTTDTLSDSYDALYVNYLGSTQQAGKIISFYQRGLMMDEADVSPYCNEIWLKDAFATSYLNLLLALEKIPANTTGENICRTDMQTIIDEAIYNGTILSGKDLTSTQKAYIDQITGTSGSYRDIEKIGYWISVDVEEDDGEYTMAYTLVYSKGDSIRKVEGTNILI